MLILLAIFCFIEAFDQCMLLNSINNMGFWEGLHVVISLILWILAGITFIKIHITIKNTEEQEKKINNLEVELDYLKKHLNITDQDIQEFIKNSDEYELDYSNSEMDEMSDEAMNGMTQEEIDNLPYFDSNSDKDE